MSGGLVGRVEQLLELAGPALKRRPLPWYAVRHHRFSASLMCRPLKIAVSLNQQPDVTEFVAAAVNLVEPLARDWQRLKRIEEAAQELAGYVRSHLAGNEADPELRYALQLIDEALVNPEALCGAAVSSPTLEEENE